MDPDPDPNRVQTWHKHSYRSHNTKTSETIFPHKIPVLQPHSEEISGLTEEGEPPPELCVGEVLREADLVQPHSVQNLGPAHLPQQGND
jgi:hypothetical protein